MKFHQDKIHLGVIFKCNFCDTYSTARKDTLEKHMILKHSDRDLQEIRNLKSKTWIRNLKSKTGVRNLKSKTPKPCTEEGCTYVDLNGSLKGHIQRVHEGIILKCHIEDCNFETSWSKNLKRHIKFHDIEVINCVVEECHVKLKGMGSLKRHIKLVHEEQTKYNYICQSDDCAFETTSKKNHLIHRKKCKHLYSPSITKPSFVDNEVSGKDSENELEDEKSHKILCNVSGCDFITYGGDETKNEEHFRNNHKGEELTQDSFILLNSAMADAMEILREIREIKEATTSK